MQAVILAAGKSQRFYPFTSFGHKSMVPMMGKPLLQHTLESLKKAKIHEVVIVVGKESPIPSSLQPIDGLTITFVTQEEALGMGHALLQVGSYLNETFFLLSGYHVDFADFAEILKKKQRDEKEVVLLSKEDTMRERYGVLHGDGERVISLEEKPEKGDKSLRVVGIYLLNKTFLQTLKKIPVEQYHFEKALNEYSTTRNVLYVTTNLPTITLKHSWDLLTIKDYLLAHIKRSISRKASIAKSAIIQGEVVISENVRILENACIKGPCYIGEGVVVGNNAILRNGVMAEQGVVVGATMEVKNSFLMRQVTTHTGFIGDSIIGSASRLAAGFCSANVRFDRKEITSVVNNIVVNTYRSHIGTILGEKVDLGTNVSTMPGVCIGNNVTIGPSTMVSENVEDNTLLYTKFEKVVKKKSTK